MSVGDKFDVALVYASRIHRDQTRKGGDIPYVSHLLAVASLALEHGADEDTAVAALLHDSQEDQGVADEEIASRFGDRVLGIVQETGEADKSLPWRQRKEAYIEHLQGASDEAVLVSLCDKVHNAETMARDHADEGDAFWDRFNAGRDEQAWNYEALLSVFKEREAEPRLVAMLEDSVQRLFP